MHFRQTGMKLYRAYYHSHSSPEKLRTESLIPKGLCVLIQSLVVDGIELHRAMLISTWVLGYSMAFQTSHRTLAGPISPLKHTQ